MKALTEMFSDPKFRSMARLCCPIDGPTKIEVMLQSIIDEVFGADHDSKYKAWVRRLYRLGFISRIPREWEPLKQASSSVMGSTAWPGGAEISLK
jgi:hypothetical protein